MKEPLSPRFVVVSGPPEGRTLPIEQPIFAIGRHADNDLQLLEIEVSRRHCEVRRQGERFVLTDLDSRHGTFVNTVPVRERELAQGDLVQIGTTGLLFLVHSSTPQVHRQPSPGGDLTARSTIRKPPGEALYLSPERVRAALTAPAPTELSRLAADLEVLLELATAVQDLRTAEPLAHRLLELLLQALPAERGAVLLVDDEEPRIVASHGADEEEDNEEDGDGDQDGFPISRTILSRVLDQQVGLLCDDVRREDGLEAAASIRNARLCSLLAVPLTRSDQRLGALYFDTSEVGAFEEHHLELLTAAAGIAALALDNARYIRWLRSENRRLSVGADHGMVGESAAMKRLEKFIERVAPADSTVLIRGESGTGKELAAQALHRASQRADGPFVAINCATLSETLLESELFGHERGAFTGAVARRLGKLEAAHGGTLFLDEVGEVPPTLQAKLLRVLQEREFERVGGSRPIQVDVRLVAATNRDLEAAIRDGKFRDDLYYRLNVIAFVMPTLRERRDDIPLLARHFARLHGERLKRRVAGLDPAARRALVAYDWPGNVRQLANTIERAIVLGEDELIRAEDLPDEVLEGGDATVSDYQAVLTATKKKLILDALDHADGDLRAAAAALGLHVNSLHRLIRNLGLKTELGSRAQQLGASPERIRR